MTTRKYQEKRRFVVKQDFFCKSIFIGFPRLTFFRENNVRELFSRVPRGIPRFGFETI